MVFYMKYWLNLYTWRTWQEFLAAGGQVSGFREGRWKSVQHIKQGDIFLCYLTGLSRFFAIEEITGAPFKDNSPIWGEDSFPCRLPVKVLLALEPQFAVPVKSLKDELSYFQNMKSPHSWTGAFRGSPVEIKHQDAELIIAALQEAEQNPVEVEFDERKLDRKVPVFETKMGAVSIPENEEPEPIPVVRVQNQEAEDTTHEEIQWLLLYLGEKMGLDLWVASNDKNKAYNGQRFQDLARIRKNLPVQFDAATNRTIELIDVLWLQGNSIVAAFEVEHTTSVYSGLLRMADLITMQPNIKIPLYIVAPDERYEKVQKEINRPVFSKALNQSLPKICQYIPYSELKSKIQQAEQGGFLRYLRPDFLDEISESVELDEV
jgi:hypothetical protein